MFLNWKNEKVVALDRAECEVIDLESAGTLLLKRAAKFCKSKSCCNDSSCKLKSPCQVMSGFKLKGVSKHQDPKVGSKGFSDFEEIEYASVECMSGGTEQFQFSTGPKLLNEISALFVPAAPNLACIPSQGKLVQLPPVNGILEKAQNESEPERRQKIKLYQELENYKLIELSDNSDFSTEEIQKHLSRYRDYIRSINDLNKLKEIRETKLKSSASFMEKLWEDLTSKKEKELRSANQYKEPEIQQKLDEYRNQIMSENDNYKKLILERHIYRKALVDPNLPGKDYTREKLVEHLWTFVEKKFPKNHAQLKEVKKDWLVEQDSKHFRDLQLYLNDLLTAL